MVLWRHAFCRVILAVRYHATLLRKKLGWWLEL